MDTSSRLSHLDAVRGLAALAVAVYHAADRLSPGYAAWCVSVFDLGAFSTTLFFLLSGIVIPLSRERSTAGLFLRRRLRRLFPLALPCVLVALLLAASGRWVGFGSTGESYDALPLLLAGLTLAPQVFGQPFVLGVAWTLQTDLAWYTVCLPVKRLPRLVPVLLSALACVLPTLFTTTLAMCGVGAARGRLRWLAWSLTALACLQQDDGAGRLVARLLALACLPLLLRPWNAPRWAVWLGDISYPLYLVHTLVYAALPAFLWPACVPLAWALEWHTHRRRS